MCFWSGARWPTAGTKHQTHFGLSAIEHFGRLLVPNSELILDSTTEPRWPIVVLSNSKLILDIHIEPRWPIVGIKLQASIEPRWWPTAGTKLQTPFGHSYKTKVV